MSAAERGARAHGPGPHAAGSRAGARARAGAPPRIALVTPNFGAGSGGVGSLVRFLYGALLAGGEYRPEVISLATSAADEASVALRRPATWLRGVRVQAGEFAGIPFRHVGAWLSEHEGWRYRPRRALTRMLNDYDLVQVISGTPPWACVALGVTAPLLLWTATLSRADRESRLRSEGMMRRALGRYGLRQAETLERNALGRVSTVFALSRYTREAVVRSAPEAHALLAPCGIDIRRFRPDPSREGGYILAVSRFSDPRKNPRLLFEAYDALVGRYPLAPDLVVVGSPPPPKALEGIVAAAQGRIRLLGVRSDDELPGLYAGASVFALSSDEEGLGIPILEAMASGLPVVSTDCGGPGTSVVEGETGFLTPVGDVQAFSAALERLVRHPELRRALGRAGREAVERHFTIEAAARVFTDEYDRLLERRDTRQTPRAVGAPGEITHSLAGEAR